MQFAAKHFVDNQYSLIKDLSKMKTCGDIILQFDVFKTRTQGYNIANL